ncbi:30S ribosomal protein S4 [Candidatus Falkowbacteria bacterium RIFOXYB2_FULL_38_15]|uniref:Small ribosomal subunit protein uS4 n=1 Tax=Candidatus Falkowbacteria bacterium RIFOXYA2_FULL_38_12 TaxID=1797993 RepID=A0A1F5S4F3_9BACT|nr:MAG: 30S ribosomal protein S4 [Candidatus Falkowbacteria bacterium RIFOXYA2_FULL_38_12]OGF33262.1 MAG: 30S ribosomal protein S4 [Candidatus Falkowbacteria bacterium RIFOXYB2_FULL_38_15]OGF42363.1 MAG: 30S ribosomal protein S4 [Candidatus Falkowbacteria bacterium RIFOXYD2_FULL_39_16]
MAKEKKSKCARCRREGEKLFLKGDRCGTAKCAFTRRSYPPGVHGPKGKVRLTGYGTQLREKQKARRIYSILEKQFKNYFIKASKKKGDTSDFLLQLLEMQLDNVVYRLGFARSRQQARQVVGHGLIFVNNKKVNIPSFQVKAGQTISIKPSMLEKPLFQNLPQILKKHETPNWLAMDIVKLEGKVLGTPKKEEVKTQFDPKLIVEFYSR